MWVHPLTIYIITIFHQGNLLRREPVSVQGLIILIGFILWRTVPCMFAQITAWDIWIHLISSTVSIQEASTIPLIT